MSLHYHQGTFVTDNKSCLSSGRWRSPRQQGAALGLSTAGCSKEAMQHLQLHQPSCLQGNMQTAPLPMLGPGGMRGRKPPNLTKIYATTFATTKS